MRAITPGARVSVRGIVTEPSLNGQLGIAVEWDVAEGRWGVDMDEGPGKLLRPQNLELIPSPSIVPGARVSVRGIATQPFLNGQLGTVVEWDVAESRWKVHMDSGIGGKLLKPQNLQLWKPERSFAEAKAEPELAPTRAIAPGARVSVHNIVTQPSLNGQHGTVVEWDVTESRWRVDMDSGAGGKLLKPQNLELCTLEAVAAAPELAPSQGVVAGARVRVRDIVTQPSLNGQLGTAVEWDVAESRWRVAMDDGDGVLLKLQNLEQCEPAFAPGARVSVRGVVTAPLLNGQLGTVVGWDAAECRWRVDMDDGGEKLLKPQNLELGKLEAVAAAPKLAPSQGVAPGARVRVRDIVSQPSLNGQLGTVVEWDAAESRWRVDMDGGVGGKLLKAQNLQTCSKLESASAAGPQLAAAGAIAPGARVSVCGVVTQPSLNGQRGTVAEWDGAECRWRVDMDGGASKLLKPQNLALCQPGAGAAAAAAAAAVPELQPPQAIAPGARVRVRNIATQPSLNGQLGTAVEWDTAESRWGVDMDEGPGKLLKPQNLELVPMQSIVIGARVSVRGIVTQPSLNGQLGTVVGWDEAENRWRVDMDEGPGKLLRAHNLELPAAAAAGVAAAGAAAVAAAAAAPELVPTPGIVPGARVCVCGLVGQPSLNGQLGTVVEWDQAEQRWSVDLDGGAGKLFRPQNLELRKAGAAIAAEVPPAEAVAPGARVRVRDIITQPSLNGQCGTVAEWDKAESRWRVDMDDGAGKLLKPQNLELCTLEAVAAAPELKSAQAIAPGARVCVRNVVTQPSLNGQLGTAVEWDEAESRWGVAMDDGDGKLLKPQNLELWQLAMAPGARIGPQDVVTQPSLDGQPSTGVE